MAGATMTQARGAAAGSLEDRPAVLGYALVVLLVALGLVIYFVGAQGLSGRPADLVIGEALGIVAAVLLGVTAILAVRLRPLEWLFGDMTKVYVAHGIVGLTMFGLVTVHPILYVIGALPHTNAAAGIIVPFKLVVLDWISWITIALALLPTLFVRLPFDLWRWSHLFLGAALVDTGISVTITSNTFDTFQIPALRIYLFVLYGVALAAILYMAVFRRIVEPKHEYRVAGADHHAETDSIELHLEPVARPLRFRAGQFTYVDLLDDRVQVKRGFGAHPYSISSAPADDGRLSVIVEAQGETTRRIQAIVDDDEARALVHGAYGRLAYAHHETTPQLWLGGGIGITPFLSLAEELAAAPGGRDVVLVAGVDHAAAAFFAERLSACEERARGALRVIVWNREERGVPTLEALREEIPDLAERAVLMSGPEPMISALTHQLHAAGVSRIHSEVTIGPPRRWRSGSPGLRFMRGVIAVEMVLFVAAVVVSTVGRAVS
jgi:predicted ferric reductase